MTCPLCKYEGEFKKDYYISALEFDSESIEGYDDYGNGRGTRALTFATIGTEEFSICPKCGIVLKLPKVDANTREV